MAYMTDFSYSSGYKILTAYSHNHYQDRNWNICSAIPCKYFALF